MDINHDDIINFYDLAELANNWLEPVYDYSYLGSGLVMAWSNPSLDPNTRLGSGWSYTYGEDPDYTNVTVSVIAVTDNSVTGLGFGFEDIFGNKMLWQWDVPNPLPRNTRTQITINTALSGASAANPVATRYTEDVGFDITQVIRILATEWANQPERGTGAPSPNGNPMDLWNFWEDLVVIPNPNNPPPVYYKWRQPAQFVGDRGNFWGWDEISIDPNKPLLADDWCCTDNRPITDVHWWGSFPNRDPNLPGWLEPVPPPPPSQPTAFHIGIWTDTPGDPNGQDLTQFSHPNEMIFDQYVSSYDVNFVGYDRDPRDSNHPITDSCFKFSVDLDPNFVQDPNSNQIYWLSIAAVYNPYSEPEYVFGWKTRPHYFNDDAVRIESLTSNTWPPVTGDFYKDGTPLECPEYCSWDLAFELTTDVNDPNSCPCFRK
jgi:hypothetical protein